MMIVLCTCPLCGKVSEVNCDDTAYFEYVTTSTTIQQAFPDMDIHARETLISGMCLPCQEKFFIEEDDDEGYDLNPYHCDEECGGCQDYDCPLNTNEDN